MKYVIIALVLIVLGIGAYYVLGGPEQEPVSTPNAPVVEEQTPAPSTEEPQQPAALITVTYTDQGFTPENISIPAGTTVHFVNQSSRDLWVGSDDHPTHTKYDGTTREQHCAAGGSFDQCARSGPGTSWDFTFTKTGTFGYHNHAGAQHTGTVTVR